MTIYLVKVVQVTPGAYPIPSPNKATAIEHIIFKLAVNLSLLRCESHIVDISESNRKEITGVKIHETLNPVWLRPKKNFTLKSIIFAVTSAFTLFKLLLRNRVDVVHTHYSYSGLSCLLVCKLLKILHVHTTHAHDLLFSRNLTILKGFVELLVLKGSDHIVAETVATKNQLSYRFNINPKKVSVIVTGVDIPFSHDSVDSYVNDRLILSVGRISPRKNQLTLIESIPTIIKSYSDVKFVFAGPIEDSSYFREISKTIVEKGISNHVQFCGEISRALLDKLYRNAFIFVFPTIAEIQGLVLLEAMSYGLPVVASNIGPISDLVKVNPESALLVDPMNPDEFTKAITALLESKDLRTFISSNAVKLVSNFSWEHTSKETYDLYKNLISIKN